MYRRKYITNKLNKGKERKEIMHCIDHNVLIIYWSIDVGYLAIYQYSSYL